MSQGHTNELTIKEVGRENWRDALQLRVHPEQQRFISDVVPVAAIALAKAYIRPRGLVWLPYAFYLHDTMIGFTELAYEPESTDNYWIYHFFIDTTYQGQGYGKKCLSLFLAHIKQQHPHCRSICLTVHPENILARHVYTSVGFQQTKDILDGEPVYRFIINRSLGN